MKKTVLAISLALICCGISLGQATIFSDNLSSFPTGWTLSPSSGWTIATSRYNSASSSARGDDANPYANSQTNTMSRAVSLSGYSSATLSFYVWQYTESGYDYLYVDYYSGSAWTMAWSRAGSYQSWALQSVTIPTTATQLRFRFTSDGSVTYEGVYVDDIVLTASGGATAQNDAGSGGDAGDTFAAALQVNPGSWSGCYLDATDRNDYYKFSVTSGQAIKVKITPPSSADYDLYLYNPSQTQKSSSTSGAGIADSVVYTADATGTWYAKAYEYSGTGNYSLVVSVSGGSATPVLAVSMNSWSPTSAAQTSGTVNVTNSGSSSAIAYTVTSNQTWLTVSSASGSTPGSFTMTASANSGAARSATVTVTATTAGVSGSPKTIAVSQAAGTASGQLKIVCFDVGQGDATFIQSPTGKYILIDGGPGSTVGTKIWKFLRDSVHTHHLDYTFVSHYHSDHIAGLRTVIDSVKAHGIDSIKVGCYDRGGSYTTTDYSNYVSSAGSKRTTAVLGQTFDIGGGAMLQVVCRNGKTISGDSITPGSEENSNSLGLLLSFNGFKMIIASDIGGYNSGSYKNQESILAPDIGSVSVLYVNHHGSATSSNPTWVATLDPQASIISCGTGNSFGHPTAEALTRLAADPGANNYIYQTETGSGGTIPAGRGRVMNSNIWIVVSGTSFTVAGNSYGVGRNVNYAAASQALSGPADLPGLAITSIRPNPVRGGQATIAYQLKSSGFVTVGLYNMLGQKVRTLADGYQAAGAHALAWNGSDDRSLSSGVYFIRMAVTSGSERYQDSKRILLVK